MRAAHPILQLDRLGKRARMLRETALDSYDYLRGSATLAAKVMASLRSTTPAHFTTENSNRSISRK
jgi:hypothetical protein